MIRSRSPRSYAPRRFVAQGLRVLAVALAACGTAVLALPQPAHPQSSCCSGGPLRPHRVQPPELQRGLEHLGLAHRLPRW
jgi:hypothetical protein